MKIKKANFSIGVFAVIFDRQKKVLLVKRNDIPIWNLPGGGVNANENPLEALAREVKEEIGAQIATRKLFGIYFKKGKDEIVFSYLVKPKPFLFKSTDEAAEMKYFAVNQLPKNLPESHRERIKDAPTFNGKIKQKIQAAGSSQRANLLKLG